MEEGDGELVKRFMDGRCQAVRLPKESCFEGTEVRIRRFGSGVLPGPAGHGIAAPDMDRVRKVIHAIGSHERQFAAGPESAMRKLEGPGKHE